MVFSRENDRVYPDRGRARTDDLRVVERYTPLLITPLERFYGMAESQMKEAFAEWLKRWIEDMYGVYPVPENNYKPYRKFTEYIKSNYATVRSWLSAHSFPDERNISRLCTLRDIEIPRFWVELQEINKELNRERGIVVPELGKTVETAEELMALAANLSESERVRFLTMLASKIEIGKGN
jgi:hypothetical protein